MKPRPIEDQLADDAAYLQAAAEGRVQPPEPAQLETWDPDSYGLLQLLYGDLAAPPGATIH